MKLSGIVDDGAALLVRTVWVIRIVWENVFHDAHKLFEFRLFQQANATPYRQIRPVHCGRKARRRVWHGHPVYGHLQDGMLEHAEQPTHELAPNTVSVEPVQWGLLSTSKRLLASPIHRVLHPLDRLPLELL